MRWLMRIVAVVMGLSAATELAAAELVRDRQLIETVSVQEVSLATPPREAFDHLFAMGFRAGDIQNFDGWQGDGIELVRSGGAEGVSRLIMGRRDGRLTSISESWNRPGDPFDAQALIAGARSHFGIGADDPGCRAASERSGNCRVQDAEAPEDVDLVFGLQVLPGMLIRYVESRAALAPR